MSVVLIKPVYAYEWNSKWEVTDDGYFVVKSNDVEAPSRATLYIYYDSEDRDVKNIKTHYLCYWINKDGAYETIMYPFHPMNLDDYDTLKNGKVWIDTFCIENGEYIFDYPEGLGTPGSLPSMKTLNTNFEFEQKPEGYPEVPYIPTPRPVENETIRLYVMYGNPEWMKKNYSEFQNWAVDHEKSFYEEEKTKNESYGITETITVTGEELEPINPAEEPTIVEERIEEPPLEEKETETPEKENNSLLIGGICFCILLFAGFILGKDKKQNNDY